MSPHTLQVGDHLIDLLNPDPATIDPVAVIRRLSTIRRFGGEPSALTVLEHQELTGLVARVLAPTVGHEAPCREWGRRHDLHEGVIGDIVSPVARLTARHGPNGLDALKRRIDKALAPAFGSEVTPRIREVVGRADAIAASIEWVDVMNGPPVDWLVPVP
ncbi:MAG: hypothetical protein IE919_18795, partial [Thioclava sp.]